MIVKKCRPEDLSELRQLAIQTFIDTYSVHNTPEVTSEYLENAFSEKQMQKEIDDPESEFYVLLLEDQYAGYIKLNEGNAQTESREDDSLEIERIYVDRKHQGRGFGKLLLEQAVAVARDKKKDRIWLGVWEHNPNAIGFYEKQGFTKTGTHLFMIGGEAQIDWVMEKRL